MRLFRLSRKRQVPHVLPGSMESLEVLVARWRKEPIELLPPEPPERVAQVFSDLGQRVTGEILKLYAQLGGMTMMDEEGWRLWPLAEIEEQNKTCSPDGVLFSDYLIDIWCFRLKATADGKAEVLIDMCDRTPPRRIARSLSEFFAEYVRDAQGILNSTAGGDA